MSIVSDLAKRVGQLPQVAEQILINTLEEQSAFIEDKITEQMSQGKRGDNSDILPSYDPDYARLKAQLGLQSAFVDLRFTGDFYQGIQSQVQKTAKALNIEGTDEKTPFLLKKYDVREQLLRLSEENLTELQQDFIIPDQQEGLVEFLTIR